MKSFIYLLIVINLSIAFLLNNGLNASEKQTEKEMIENASQVELINYYYRIQKYMFKIDQSLNSPYGSKEKIVIDALKYKRALAWENLILIAKRLKLPTFEQLYELRDKGKIESTVTYPNPETPSSSLEKFEFIDRNDGTQYVYMIIRDSSRENESRIIKQNGEMVFYDNPDLDKILEEKLK